MRHYLPFLTLVLACGGGDDGDPIPHSNGEGPAPFDPDQTYQPDVEPGVLSPVITNELLPFPVGATWRYQADTEDGLEVIAIEVLAETRDTWGAAARVVRDTVTVDGELAEDTWDWYAQDDVGHVWYLGEDTFEYENGEVVCECGAWEAGVDGALPGVVMLAAPAVGDVYRQEYFEGEAEDVAEVVEVGIAVSVPAGDFTGCVKTRDRSALDPELDEHKYYCPGVGNVLVEEGDVRVELIEYAGLE
jgi:hypothetical protein